MLYIIEKLFHVYDGFVFPNEDFWDKINSFLMDVGLNTKDSYGYALIIFLKAIDLSILGFDILETLKTVQIIYFQLRRKRYSLYNDSKKVTHFSSTDHLDKGLQQVCMYIAMYVSFTLLCTEHDCMHVVIDSHAFLL